MSPQSRKRKKKPRSGRHPRLRTVADPLDELLAEFRAVLTGDAVDGAEAAGSTLLGSMRAELGAEAADELVVGLIEHCATRRSAESLSLLRVLAHLAIETDQRVAAAAAADMVAAAGIDEPGWARQLGAVRCIAAHQLRDVWGDQASVLAVFERDGARHGVFALVDFNHLGGWVQDLAVTDDVDGLLRELGRAEADSAGVGLREVLAPERARRLIEDGIGATDSALDADVGEDYQALHALALARCRAMPGPEPAAEPPEFDDDARDALVARFLDESHFERPVAPDAARYCAQLVVDYGCDYDAGQPLRVGPEKWATLLLDYLPRTTVLDDTDRDALPVVARAWTDWAAAQTGLPPAAMGGLYEALDAVFEDFDDAYDDESNVSPTRAFLADLGPDVSVEQVRATMDRRMFAMPYFGATIGDEDYERLDPNDEDELRLLVIGEHPELHEALSDPAFDADAAGFSPQLHITVDTAVVQQLWHDDPPEVWPAAQRLRDAGMERLDVIHEIAAVFVEHVWHLLAEDRAVDPAAYPAALSRLGRDGRRPRPATGRSRKPAARPAAAEAVAGDAVLVLKIALAGARPPIWRRLRVPARVTLDQLHAIIQVSFGWEDEHLHVFEVGATSFAPAGTLDLAEDSAGVPLGALVHGAGSTLRYVYDMGDGWRHDIAVEKVEPADGVGYAVCAGGRRAGPAEDCGGIGGWEYLCEVLADPDHPDYEDKLDWLGYIPDPAAFDLDEINSRLRRLPVGGPGFKG